MLPVPENRGWNDSGTGMLSKDGPNVSGSIETPLAKFSFALDMLNVFNKSLLFQTVTLQYRKTVLSVSSLASLVFKCEAMGLLDVLVEDNNKITTR